MSLLGIDVGTTGCKVLAIRVDGTVLGMAQREYDIVRPRPDWAELDSRHVWEQVQDCIREVVPFTQPDPVTALAVSSMGEAMTPVSRDRVILGNCLMGFDARGSEATTTLASLDPLLFFERSGNVVANSYGGCKLIWRRDHQPELFEQTDRFFGWADLVAYLLGGEPVMEYSLANRTLFLDLRQRDWSDETLAFIGMPREKLPRVVPSGTITGTISRAAADNLGLPRDVQIVLGAHDQCANATGSGVIRPGMAAYGLGTYITIAPVYDAIPPAAPMIEPRLNVEHHALPGLYISFYYNLTGGALLKWFRDTFARAERAEAEAAGRDVYDLLLADMPADPTNLMVLPHFAPTGPPYFQDDVTGLIAGLTLNTSRGEFIKGLLEGVTYYFRDGLDRLAQAGITIDEFRMTGGGARSDQWLQIKADILGKPLTRPRVTEATALGAAMLAGLGTGVYASAADAIQTLVQIDRVFEPDAQRHALYEERFSRYGQLYPFMEQLRQ